MLRVEKWDSISNRYYIECETCQKGIYGRRNQKFCSSVCKSKKANDKARQFRISNKEFLNWLKNNENILRNKLSKGNIHSETELKQAGFLFEAAHAVFKKDNIDGKVLAYCLTFGLIKVSDQKYKIIKLSDYE